MAWSWSPYEQLSLGEIVTHFAEGDDRIEKSADLLYRETGNFANFRL
jgi:hypothetical protein